MLLSPLPMLPLVPTQGGFLWIATRRHGARPGAGTRPVEGPGRALVAALGLASWLLGLISVPRKPCLLPKGGAECGEKHHLGRVYHLVVHRSGFLWPSSATLGLCVVCMYWMVEPAGPRAALVSVYFVYGLFSKMRDAVFPGGNIKTLDLGILHRALCLTLHCATGTRVDFA